jgi:hypothetical protein
LSSLIVRERNHNKLFLERSKLREVGGLFATVVFFGFWYYGLLRKEMAENNFIDAVVLTVSNEPMLLLFLGAPLLASNQIFSGIKTIISGENYTFDRLQSTILKNGVKILQFSSVQAIQIRMLSGGDSSDEYRLSLLLISGDKQFIETSNSESGIKKMADHIADVLNVSVTIKE